MRRRLHPRIALAGLLVASVLFACSGHAVAQGTEAASPTLEGARRRWDRLSPEQQEKARRDYERYRSLSEEERRDLAERARRLDETREGVLRAMAPDVRARFAELDPKKRRELVDELVENEAREIGRLVRDQLPEPWVERLEKARPEDRARFLLELKQKQADRAQRAVADLSRRLGLTAEEVARIEALPEPERRATLLRLRKQQTVRDVEARGLPKWLPRERWDAWRALPPPEFFEALQNAQREHADARQAEAADAGGAGRRSSTEHRPEEGAPRSRDAGVADTIQAPGANALGPAGEIDRASTSEPASTGGASSAERGSAAQPARAAERENTTHRVNAADRAQAIRELGQAIRVRADDVLELADLPAPERERRLLERRRARVLAVLVRTRLVAPERLDELERLPPKRLFEVLRPMLSPAGGGAQRPVVPATRERSSSERSGAPARGEGGSAPQPSPRSSEDVAPAGDG